MKSKIETATVCQVEARQPTKREAEKMRRDAVKRKLEALKRLEERQRLLFPPIYEGEILSIKDAVFYLIIEEMTGGRFGPSFPIKYAISPSGDYLGDPKTAYHLVNKFGICAFKKTEPTHSVCSIGYSPKKKLWYGWSHRAIHGFKKKRDAIRFARSVS